MQSISLPCETAVLHLVSDFVHAFRKTLQSQGCTWLEPEAKEPLPDVLSDLLLLWGLDVVVNVLEYGDYEYLAMLAPSLTWSGKAARCSC